MADIPEEGGPVPTADEIRSALVCVVESAAFAKSQRQRTFLRYLAEETLQGRAESLKESTLAVEIFGRGTDFDSRTDNIVHVEARRQRLQTYYTSAPAGGVVIDLPTGGYVPAFSRRPEVLGRLGSLYARGSRRRGWCGTRRTAARSPLRAHLPGSRRGRAGPLRRGRFAVGAECLAP